MSTQTEREQNDLKVDFIISTVAGTNKDALEYLTFIAACSRIVDDVFDEFTFVKQNDLLTLIELLFIRIPANKFYRDNQDLLFAHHITMWNAWEASNMLSDGDKTDQIYAHVLRDYINEILPLVALITQGYNKMKEVNSLIRSLFKKELGE